MCGKCDHNKTQALESIKDERYDKHHQTSINSTMSKQTSQHFVQAHASISGVSGRRFSGKVLREAPELRHLAR